MFKLFLAFILLAFGASLEGGAAMLVAARESFAISRAKRWTNPYVTDGLIAWWDGVWNAGPGVHDASATTWVDLSHNHYDLTVNISGQHYWTEDSLKVTHSATVGAYRATEIADSICTIEAVFRNTRISNGATVAFFSPSRSISMDNRTSGNGYRYTLCYNRPCGVGAANTYDPANYASVRMYLAGTFASGADKTLSAAYIDGYNVGTHAGTWGINTAAYPVTVGGRSSWNGSTGNICCVRLHSRPLTAAELATNYAIDKARFNLP